MFGEYSKEKRYSIKNLPKKNPDLNSEGRQAIIRWPTSSAYASESTKFMGDFFAIVSVENCDFI